MTGALLSGATGIFLAHNHPGGSMKPSRNDIAITKKMIAAAEVLDLRFLDHLIVNGELNSYIGQWW